MQKLEDKIEDNDNYERRDTMIFSGNLLPAHSNMANCTVIIFNLTKEHLFAIFCRREIKN